MIRLFILIIYLFPSHIALCQNINNYKFYHLDTEDNLSQNTIHCILQDKEGYIWFGTDGGLNRWNGYKFTNYIHQAKDSTSIGQGRINCLFEDKHENLWIGTFQDGISRYNKKNNQFISYKNIEGDSEDQRNNVFQMVAYKNSIIYGTFGKGLYLLNINTKKSTKIDVYDQHNELIEKLVVQKLVFDNDSNLWIGHSKGLLQVTKENINNINHKIIAHSYLKGFNVEAIAKLDNLPVLVGTQFNGVFYYNKEQNNILKYQIPVKGWSDIENSAIRDFIIDRYNNLWIATDGNGIFTINEQGNNINHYQNELNNYFTLSSDNLICMYKDKKHNIWVGTYNNGVNYINYYKQSFNHTRGFGKNNELNNNAVLSFCELSQKEFLIGTDGGGINVYNRTTGNYELLKLPKGNSSSNKSVIVCMKLDGNKLYIGTYLDGLYVYDIKTKNIKNYRSGKGKYDLKNNNIWSIAIDKHKHVWLASLGNGIFRFNPQTEEFVNYSSNANEPSSISDNYVSNLLIDSNDKLWIATFNNGINILIDEEKGHFKSFRRDKNTGLSGNDIWKIFEDSEKNIWVGTQDAGLCLFDKKNETFRSFTTHNGLPSNTIKSIIEDKNQNLWLGTNKGLVKFKLENDSAIIKIYNQQSGLQSNEFNFGANYETKDHYLFFGGKNGFNFFHPNQLRESSDIGSLVIEDIRILDRTNNSGESISVKKAMNNNMLNLDYNLAVITIEFALLDFTVPELNAYDYKLEGFDINWTLASSSNKVTYTNLDPGDYTFMIRATNSLGYKTQDIKRVFLHIESPYWKKLWFKLLVLLSILMITIIAYKLRIKSFARDEIQLKKAVSERTDDLVKLNEVLGERNAEIELKSEELKTKSENLVEVNGTLEKSKTQIEKQNIELEKHRNNLELLVDERTKELEKAKLKAIESEQLKMAFLANMSHEIRTPMNAIVGFSSLLAIEDYTLEERKQFIELIGANSNSLLLLIDDILDLSRLEANQMIINKTSFDLIKLLDEIVANWSVIQGEKQTEVSFEFNNLIKHESLFVNSDQSRIKQITNNLIDNAFKFTNKGKVSLSASVDENDIIIKISDTGIGIKEEGISKIFNRFTKSDASSDNKYRGAGLGLTISKKLATLLEGDLWAESAFGKGSTFFFKFPK